MYYDQDTVKKTNGNIIGLWTKTIFSEEGKTRYFSLLQNINRAPGNPSLISYYMVLQEIECGTNKIKPSTLSIYNKEGRVIYATPESEKGKWDDIYPNSIGEKLSGIVCEASDTPEETFVSSADTDSNLPAVSVNQNAANMAQKEEDVLKLLGKWLRSWQAGDRVAYRSCYAPHFQSRGMNLDAWIAHKTNLRKKNKNIKITMDNIKISASDKNITAVFNQYYSSSKFKDSGKKTLELIKINDEWKIYREIM